MPKKRELIQRRRQITKTRKGLEHPAHEKQARPLTVKREEKATMKDLWIAVGIVAGIIALFVGLYYFSTGQLFKAAAIPTLQVLTATPGPSPTVGAGQTVVPTTATGSTPLSWSQPPAMAIDPAKSYTAVVKTVKGDFTIQLYADKAPITVNNFVFLARQGFYNGVTFHRVLPGFVAQAGDPTGTGSGGPGYYIQDEVNPALKHDSEGVVAMANAGVGTNTNGSQFYITYAPQPSLDGGYSIFGKVTSGMDVVKALTPRDPQNEPNAPAGDKILSIDIVEQ
jgi:cyclophilin family peptidyl-prolyl cis-trans isomerase